MATIESSLRDYFRSYLVSSKIDNGLLINFSEDGVEVKRKFREFNKKKDPVNSEDPVILSK